MILPLVLSAMVATAVSSPTEKYTTKYDDVDIDEILTNERLYHKYFDCLKGGHCTPDGEELRDLLPDAFQGECSKCSEKQKAGAEKVIRHLIEKRPEDYEVLEKIYDPDGIYKKKYHKEAKKVGLKV